MRAVHCHFAQQGQRCVKPTTIQCVQYAILPLLSVNMLDLDGLVTGLYFKSVACATHMRTNRANARHVSAGHRRDAVVLDATSFPPIASDAECFLA